MKPSVCQACQERYCTKNELVLIEMMGPFIEQWYSGTVRCPKVFAEGNRLPNASIDQGTLNDTDPPPYCACVLEHAITEQTPLDTEVCKTCLRENAFSLTPGEEKAMENGCFYCLVLFRTIETNNPVPADCPWCERHGT